MEISHMKIEERQKEDEEMDKLKIIPLLPKQRWKTSMEKESNRIQIFERYLASMFIRGEVIVKKMITEKEQKEKQGAGSQPGYLRPCSCLLRPTWIIRCANSLRRKKLDLKLQ